MIQPSKEQERIIKSPHDKIVVISAAASGKTRVLIERIRWILRRGADPSKVVAITFTNNAADEIIERLGDDYKSGIFVGTVHSYANHLLTQRGINTAKHLRSENFDSLFEQIIMHPEAVKEVDHLLLDEAQDSNYQQFDFMMTSLEPRGFTIFGDPRQSIYGFNGGNPKMLLNLADEPDVTVYTMNDNYRNGQEIINYSDWILSHMKDIPTRPKMTCMRGQVGQVSDIRKSQIADTITEPYSDWAILCRTNRMVDEITYMLNKRNIPTITFKQGDNSNKELQRKINSNAVKVLTSHSSKGLQFPNVIVAEPRWKGEENLRLMYVAATRAMNKLYWVKG